METVLEPGLSVCDPHHHLIDYTEPAYLMPQFLADTAAGHQVVQSVFVECMTGYRSTGSELLRPVGETELVVAADPSRFIAGIVGFADLRSPEVGDVLEAHLAAADGRFRGIRYAAATDPSPLVRDAHTKPPAHLLADASFRAGMAMLSRYGLSFDAWVFHPQLAEVAELARAFPELLIVLNHLGGPVGIGPYSGRRDEVRVAWRSGMAQVAACPNVSLKLGGIGMPLFGLGWHRRQSVVSSAELGEAWAPDIVWAIETFGADRCMFESNFPVDSASCTYRTLWNAYKLIVAAGSAAEKASLFHETARRVYRLR